MQENKSLYKIYSRNRLNIFKKKNNSYKYNKKNGNKMIAMVIIILIAIFTFNILYK